ncbi:LEAF RUST 10 DISEASE-RESISTANCE LOCUS RECEPTOR-LIKE PROTEIN KINASE-like 1.1 isoform X2 [Prunus dulcis]|uniref:LEAF RUST 10 DISEASE-RESISTANCE LOCUS RECEPTOR-LIKE PROTEIN KINASE-like 1.1 isoform X2 n=1 Tax=Prunus dulcis TaxID=3755 RepID=UPI001482928C|nr:LEAF RUST 10 DISEASE-RESISTANCE LOCUS RECEPTOR-LIKE PROTEIN KINASE-like 1.1 isoform X2 [Prunus dulcis]
MAPVALFIFSLLTHLVVLHSIEELKINKGCSPEECQTHPPECGWLFTVNCSDRDNPRIQLKEEGYWHEFEIIPEPNMIFINDRKLEQRLKTNHCNDQVFNDLRLPDPSPVFDELFAPNLTLIKCSTPLNDTELIDGCRNHNYTYYTTSPDHSLLSPPPSCSVFHMPRDPYKPFFNLSALTTTFHLEFRVREECHVDKGKFKCSVREKGDKLGLTLGLGIGLGCPVLLAVCLFLLWCYKKKGAASNFLSRNISSQPHTNSDIEGGVAYFGVPVFTYTELEEATNHFDSEKELGDGGFGTVYYGKLKDGREVAVKRLYEHNYKRVEQFMNEIEILTRLRHQNLVSLYGCTSRRSRELLLVYEYIPNGTVADHLHGERADPGALTWPIRMSIAIETANALSYLHASEIVHRDVKTTNILLDNNFCVKVADFGLSRLFPMDVTHVSTAPQGTPGYVDPEYHQCYQLTSKSDVYSFGVVLIELISSMPAVDISRHRHEINLANLAVSKIQKGLFNELVDQRLGFESDDEVRRMVIAVAELAFQCLQLDNDMRPTMCEVLEALKTIESGNDVPDNLKPAFDNAGMKTNILPPPSPDCDEIGLMKNKRPLSSPISVTQKWPSTRSTTPNASA